MPFRDRTGPWGRGSGTGFGLGFCSGYSPLSPYQYSQQIVPQLTTSLQYPYAPVFGSMVQMQNPYYNSQFGRGMGPGFGLGMGFGKGFGADFGYGRGFGLGWGQGLGMSRGRGRGFW
ncbi:DUF5320 domain-containing protein [Thermoproteota archaeon]